MESKSSTNTEPTEVMKSLKQNEQEFGLSLLASTLAHEIRNPLQTIRLHVDAAKRGASVLECLKQIADGIQQIESVVEKVQKLGEKYQVHSEPVHLRSLVDACLASVEFWLKAAGIQVRVHSHWEGEPVVQADKELIQQVLLNLMMNSIQAMPDGGLLRVEILETMEHAVVEISDTGTGRSKDHLKIVGTPFFTTKDAGSGLGLAFCRTIASLHGGRIEVESTEGMGTSVSLVIAKEQATEGEVGNA